MSVWGQRDESWMKGCTEPCQNDLLALAVFWDYSDHGQNQNSRTLCTGDRCKKYPWVHIEMFFSSVPNTVIGVYPKLLSLKCPF